METDYQKIFDVIAPTIKDERRRTRLQNALNDIKSGVEAGSIYNPTFKDAKDTLNRATEDFVRNDPGYYGNRELRDGLYHCTTKMFSLAHAASYVRDVEKNKPANDLKPLIDKIKLFIGLSDDLKLLKNKTVSGRVVQAEKTAAKKAALPQLTPEERKQLQGIFEELLSKMKANFVEYRTIYYTNIVKEAPSVFSYNDWINGFNRYSNKPFTPGQQKIFGKIYDEKKPDGTYSKSREYFRADKAKIDRVIKREIEIDTRMMFDAFQEKQTMKMAGILRGRKILKASTKLYMNLEGDIDFELTQDCSFTMRNTIVWKQSKYKKDFWQFPTRFTQVVQNGKHFANPSEERMKKDF